MNTILPSPLLAATSDSGVLLHDIIGGIFLAALLLLGIVFYRRQSQWTGRGPERAGDTGLDRTFGRVQVWGLYLLAVAATIAFFFVMPRATRQKGEASKQQNAGSKELP